MKKQGFWTKQLYVKELTPIEHAILWSNVVISVALFIAQITVYKTFNQWSVWLTLIASIISIFSVMAGVKKKPLCPLLGIIASFILLPVAWNAHVYGTMIMYGVNIIIQTLSFISWFRNVDNTASIKPKPIKWWIAVIYLAIIVGLIALFTWVEGFQSYQDFMSGKHVEIPPIEIRIFDAAVLMTTLGCCLPMVLRLKSVWIMYIINDIAQVALWICKICHETDQSQIFSHCIMLVSVTWLLITSILGLVRWYQNIKK